MRSLALLMVVLMSLGGGLLGCAKKKSSNGAATAPAPTIIDPNGPFVPEGNGPGEGPGDDWEYGATAPFQLKSIDALMDYTQQARNNPQDIRINVNLEHKGNNKFGGTVSVGYSDGGVYYEGFFTSGDSAEDNKYNVWFVKDNKTVYHGFFEDYLGAIVLVIDSYISNGDGQAPSQASGRVYYKNFQLAYAPNPWNGYLPGFGSPRTFCWFISIGPYDCRAWPDGNGVNTTRAINPDNGYKLLGSFNGLDLDQAFNGDL